MISWINNISNNTKKIQKMYQMYRFPLFAFIPVLGHKTFLHSSIFSKTFPDPLNSLTSGSLTGRSFFWNWYYFTILPIHYRYWASPKSLSRQPPISQTIINFFITNSLFDYFFDDGFFLLLQFFGYQEKKNLLKCLLPHKL